MWQTLIILYFIFGATSYLLRKVLAQKIGEHNRVINAIYFLIFLLPTAIMLSFLLPHNLDVGLINLILLIGGSIIWPIIALVSFYANRKVDVGILAIITNLSPIFTLVIALPFLHENLKSLQFLGVGLLVLSGVLASYSQLRKREHTNMEGILICLLSAALLGIAVAYERFMLSRMELGTYIIYGWGSQIFWALVFTGKELQKIPKLLSKDNEVRKTLISWGAVRTLVSVTFILSLKLSEGASVFSAASNFLSIAVVIAAYFFLKERQHLLSKGFATVLGIIGLFLVA